MYKGDSKCPKVGEHVFYRHPFGSRKRMYVTPSRIVPLLEFWFDDEIVKDVRLLSDSRRLAAHQLKNLRPDHLRMLNPTPYKVSLEQRALPLHAQALGA
jgi:nicotinate phosphoribosyltransferase